MADSWLRTCGVEDSARAIELSKRVEERRNRGEFTQDEQFYIRDITMAVSKDADFYVSGERSEIIRRLCALHQVFLHPRTISSHRPVIGKLIVFSKKLFFQMMKPLLEPMMRQQTSFNAAAVHLLAQLANEAEKKIASEVSKVPH